VSPHKVGELKGDDIVSMSPQTSSSLQLHRVARGRRAPLLLSRNPSDESGGGRAGDAPNTARRVASRSIGKELRAGATW